MWQNFLVGVRPEESRFDCYLPAPKTLVEGGLTGGVATKSAFFWSTRIGSCTERRWHELK